jgi:hypothetical protein
MARSKVISARYDYNLTIMKSPKAATDNPWSEDEMDTGTTTEENEPIEVVDDVSHEASENKEQGKFQSHWDDKLSKFRDHPSV